MMNKHTHDSNSNDNNDENNNNNNTATVAPRQDAPLGLGSLRGSPVEIGTIQRILTWPLRKDGTHKSRRVHMFYVTSKHAATTEHRQYEQFPDLPNP